MRGGQRRPTSAFLAVWAAATVGRAAAMVARECMFLAARVVLMNRYVPMPVTRFISLEVIKGGSSARRKRPVIAVTRIVPVVHVAHPSRRTVEPWSSTDEDSSHEPVGAVITVRRAVVRGVIEVTIRTNRRCADADRHLCRRNGRGTDQSSSERRQPNHFPKRHTFPPSIVESQGKGRVACN